jgi:hypothetical protein
MIVFDGIPIILWRFIVTLQLADSCHETSTYQLPLRLIKIRIQAMILSF